MPLLRVEVRNEYGLGAPELYAVANKEDPKEVLEGVAVAGLVGILRQLGDLAEFAAEVFHGLQEQVMITSSRSHKLMGRVKQIEAALPPLEKLVLAQRSHLHFAYTSGANWHVRLRCEQSHFIYSDLPRFIQDSYEQCRGPPHLNLLDKFDTGGSGSCMKRYSDPSFFRRASTGYQVANSDKVLKDKKGRKIKKRRSWRKNGEVSCGPSLSNHGGRTKFATLNMDGHMSPSQIVSTYDALKTDLGDQPNSSRNGSVDFERVSHPRDSMQREEQESKESSSSSSRMQNNDFHDYAFSDEKGAVSYDDIRSSLSGAQTGPSSFSATWNEKAAEILEPASEEYVQNGTSETVHRNFNLENEESGATHFGTAKGYGHEMSLVTSSTKIDLENEEEATHFETGEVYDHDESLVTFSGNSDQETEKIVGTHFETANGCDYDEPLQAFSGNGYQETLDREATHFETAVGYDQHEPLEKYSTNLNLETKSSGAIQFETPCQIDTQLDNENLSMPVPDDIQPGDCESENVVQENFHLDADLQHEDGESETDHYMDALNTIESECDTDLECETKKEVEQYSDADNKAIDLGVDMLIKPISGSPPSNSESPIDTSSSPDTGLDCQTTNKEVEQYSDTDNNASDLGVDMLIKPSSGSPPSNTESPIATSSSPDTNPFGVASDLLLPKTCSAVYGSPDKVTSEDISNLAPFESYVVPQPAEIANETSNSSCLADFASLTNDDALGSSNVKSVMSHVSSFHSRQHSPSIPIRETTTNSSLELQKPPPEPSSSCSIKFWTNGGLLGLEPSKPPDCSVLNVSSQVSLTSKDGAISSSTQQPDTREKSFKSIEEATTVEFSTSPQGDRKGGILTKKALWKSLSADLSVNLQKLTDSCNQSNISSSLNDGFTQNSGAVQPVTPGIESTGSIQEKSGNSSRMFELGNRLLLNGFYQKPSRDKEETSKQTSSLNDIASEMKTSHRYAEHKTFSGRNKDMLGSRSPILSPSSSPPLGHMKMSFQPVNGFEAPKLQLKFPDGNAIREGERDFFPSFQLVPEPAVPLHDVGLESDDDTFCRSSPYGSDCPSHLSASNSEQWESSESPRSKDQELYDALCRISSTESASTSWETGATTQGETNNICRPQNSFARNSVEHSQSSQLFDLPGLDSLHLPLDEEWRNDCDSKDHAEPHCPKELTPSPPPLPPPQWRAMNSQMELAEDRQASMDENLSHEFDWKLGYTITQQPKPAPVKQEQITEAAHILKSEQQELQKIRVQKEVNQGANGKEMEEKEDFLHQIRTKSFSLRRTGTAKPTVPAGTPTSFQVTAILQKANAIRQAVASDDGEDDNWSDT